MSHESEQISVIQNVTGQVVEGSNFFDRKKDLARFWRGLETDSLLLLAPRRVGKTSVLRQMKVHASSNGFDGIYVDVSDCADELRFVQRLYSAILEHHGSAEKLWHGLKESWLGKTIRSVKKAGAAGFNIEFGVEGSQWAEMGEDLAKALGGLEGKTLIQVDELPVFALKLLNRVDETNQGRIREFLYWMRRLRLSYPQVRWVLAGSIGLDTLASRLNIGDAINDLRIESLGPFDEQTARDLLSLLAASYKIELDSGVQGHLITRVGWLVPFYLQLVFDKIRHCKKPSKADVDSAFDSLLGPSHKSLFDYWRQRLRDELGRPDADYAAMLLHVASRTFHGVRRTVFQQALTRAISDADAREDKLRYLLDVLENDGYLVESTDEGKRVWRFLSPLLREYWLRRVAPPEPNDE